MKPAVAVATALGLFLVAWLLVAGMLYAMGLLAIRSGYGGGLMLIIHLVLTWVLSPAAAAYIGLSGAAAVFRSVSPQTTYVAFVSVLATLSVLMFVGSIFSPKFDALQSAMFLVQVVAVFVGARIAKAVVGQVQRGGST